MRALDWKTTPLGPPALWPQSLKTIVRVMLDSRYAMWMLWGPELTFFCNDAYLPTVGIKRDWVLGARSDKVWEEIWPDIGPRIQRVLEQGQATWDEGLLLFLERSGFPEETYHTFSYSPVYDDANRIAGMLCVVTEVTERIIGERRLGMLRDLATRSAGVETVQDACDRLISVLKENQQDIPFASLYMLDDSGKRLQLIAQAGNPPPTVESAADAPDGQTGSSLLLESLTTGAVKALPLSATNQMPAALILPVQGQGSSTCSAVLLAGVSQRRPMDDGYLGFFDLVRRTIAAAIADAQAYEAERRRAEAFAEIDRAKTAFFSNVSHEFRTPLTLLLGPMEHALASEATPGPVREQLELAHRNALRLLKMVNSLLDFSRIEAGRAQASYEPTDLATLTQELAGTFRAAIEAAGLRFIVECDTLPQAVYIDREMWEKIVLNLLSNAFKFTFEGQIEIRIRSEQTRGAPAHAVFEVVDTGVGIAPQELPRVFERFHRVEGVIGRTQEGSGIGLALVQELVKLHGGTVEVASRLRSGTSFRVRIPFGISHLPAERIRQPSTLDSTGIRAEAYVEEALRWIPAVNPKVLSTASTLPAEPAPVPNGLAGRGARIVLADDNADMRAYISQFLAPLYSVEAVADGEAALAAARRQPPALILSDVMMPRLDGFGLLKAVRADKVLAATPFILLSARAGEESRVEGLEARADDYLVKPFGSRELLSRVDALLALAQMRHSGEERLRTYMDSVTDGFFVLDKEMRFVFVNQALAVRFNRSRPEILGERIWDMFPGATSGEAYVQLNRAMSEHAAIEYEVYFPPWDRWFRDKVYPTPDGGLAVYTRDISDEKRAKNVIERQNAELREADRQKDEFLAMLAHELRNPLASIGNASEFLSRLTDRDSRWAMPLALLKRQAKQLTRLVDDLLDISRIARGRVALQERLLELTPVIEQAAETVQAIMSEKAHRFVIAKRQSPMYVYGDLSRLVQALSNVLHNAAKYTDAGGEIRLEVIDSESEIAIRVQDNGGGIPSDLLPRVFDLFVQSERTLDRSQGGLGIGLSVVKRLIELHGGSVSAESSGIGAGSTFTIRLPRAEPPRSAEPAPLALPTRTHRVVVVDDNVDAADSLAMLLRLEGHEVHTAYSAADAIEAARALRPEVMFLDIGLPEMDGYEVARQIQTASTRAAPRLIALTGYGQPEDRQRSKTAGFEGHIVKPVTPEALEAIFACED